MTKHFFTLFLTYMLCLTICNAQNLLSINGNSISLSPTGAIDLEFTGSDQSFLLSDIISWNEGDSYTIHFREPVSSSDIRIGNDIIPKSVTSFQGFNPPFKNVHWMASTGEKFEDSFAWIKITSDSPTKLHISEVIINRKDGSKFRVNYPNPRSNSQYIGKSIHWEAKNGEEYEQFLEATAQLYKATILSGKVTFTGSNSYIGGAEWVGSNGGRLQYRLKLYSPTTSDAWFQIQNKETYTDISIDFKADYIPSATYCSPVNLRIDYSSLLEKYDSVNNGGHISVYGGLQRQSDGTKYNSIISLWDVYCKKRSGGRDTIKATLISPVGAESIRYNHEGNGVSFRPDYPWKPRKWYRMLIQLGKSETTGNTTLEQWIGDLSEKKWKRLCIFDLGAPNLKFIGEAAAFLENFSPKTAGDIRSMEFKNVRIHSHTQNRWVSIYSTYLYNDSSQKIKKSGSYQYGTDDDTFWMITTGLPDCAEPQAPGIFEVSESETGSPLSL